MREYVPRVRHEEHVFRRNYEIGQMHRAFVGEPILHVEDYGVEGRGPLIDTEGRVHRRVLDGRSVMLYRFAISPLETRFLHEVYEEPSVEEGYVHLELLHGDGIAIGSTRAAASTRARGRCGRPPTRTWSTTGGPG